MSIQDIFSELTEFLSQIKIALLYHFTILMNVRLNTLSLEVSTHIFLQHLI